jgi:hypothetical protein
VQQKQDYYKAGLIGAMLVTLGFFAASPANSAGIADRSKPDPILTGGPAGPCDPQSASADYVGGTDANGPPVAPADLDKAPVPVPGQIAVPVRSGRGTAYVQADGKALAPLLNPPTSCPPPH